MKHSADPHTVVLAVSFSKEFLFQTVKCNKNKQSTTYYQLQECDSDLYC